MSDPISTGALAAAERLAPSYGPELTSDVEAALHTRGAEQRPDRADDSGSVGVTIVTIAVIAWGIYTGLRKKTADPAPEFVAETVRAELERQGEAAAGSHSQLTNIVVAEVIKAAAGAPVRITVGKSGRVTLPASVRRTLELDRGSELQLRVAGGKLELTPVVTVTPDYLWVIEPEHLNSLNRALTAADEGQVTALDEDDVRQVLTS
jgi:AbrB family looped-hinge helix DNA binding protein